MKLLTEQKSSTKMAKSGEDFVSAILYLSPHTLSGKNLCPNASPGCIATCLNTAGRGVMAPVQKGRLRRTIMFLNQRAQFFSEIQSDIDMLKRRGLKQNKPVVVRLNGTSDLPWEKFAGAQNLIKNNPTVQFYDYTKSMARVRQITEAHARGELTNLHMTFSRSETNEVDCYEALALGVNVAAVFHKSLPLTFMGAPVINGDDTDYRFLDKPGHVVGLVAKGKAKKDFTSGFIVDTRLTVENNPNI